MTMGGFRYKYLAPGLAWLLFGPSHPIRFWLDKTGLKTWLMIAVIYLFRRAAVSGTNVFSPELYRRLHHLAPAGFLACAQFHLRVGEPENLDPTYFFQTAWFRKIYARLLPAGSSPLVFFLLKQRELGLKPHWRALFPNPPRNFFRALIAATDGSLRMTGPHPIRTSETGAYAGELQDPGQIPAGDLGWGDISLNRVYRAADWARAGAFPTEELHRAVPARIMALKGVIGHSSLPTRVWTKMGYNSTLTRLNNVIALGGDPTLFPPDGNVIRDGAVDCPASTSAFLSVDIFQNYWLPKNKVQFWRLKHLPHYDRGLLLMNQVDFNYWHWLVEVLPRIVPLTERLSQGDLSGLPVFISQGMPATHEEALRLLTPRSPIIPLARQMAVRIGEALYPSDINRLYEAQREPWGNYDFRVDLAILKRLRQLILDRAAPDPDRVYPDRIIIDRASPSRSLVNRDLVLRLAVRRGFEIVSPEKLSFIEQVAMFNRARHILVPGGAGAANLMFAGAGAQIGVFCNDLPGHALSLWPTMAQVAGADLFLICGQRAFVNSRVAHDRIIVPPGYLNEFFDRAETRA